jgi:hypothetical protein
MGDQTQSEAKLCGNVFGAKNFSNSREKEEERVGEVKFSLKGECEQFVIFSKLFFASPHETPQELSWRHGSPASLIKSQSRSLSLRPTSFGTINRFPVGSLILSEVPVVGSAVTKT